MRPALLCGAWRHALRALHGPGARVALVPALPRLPDRAGHGRRVRALAAAVAGNPGRRRPCGSHRGPPHAKRRAPDRHSHCHSAAHARDRRDGGSQAVAGPHADPDSHADPNSHAEAHSHANRNRYAEAHSYADAHSHPDADANANAHPDTDAHPDPDANAHPDADADADANANPDSDSDCDSSAFPAPLHHQRGLGRGAGAQPLRRRFTRGGDRLVRRQRGHDRQGGDQRMRRLDTDQQRGRTGIMDPQRVSCRGTVVGSARP